jgi:hypothetical protein
MINEIQNGEAGASVRAKLNQMAASINDLNPKGDLFDSFLFGSTPPATRRDGSPLQIGDLLLKPNGLDYFWSGVEWLTVQAGGIAGRHTFVGNGEGFAIESATLIGYEELHSLRIQKLIFRYQLHTLGGIENAQNHWIAYLTFRGARNQLGGGFVNIALGFPLNGVVYPVPSATPNKILVPINQKADYCDIGAIQTSLHKIGAVSSYLQASFSLITRGIHP